MCSKSKLQNIFSECEAFVSYKAMKDEMDIESLQFILPSLKYDVPMSAGTDPIKCAKDLMNNLGSLKTVVLLPGTRFDRGGGRFGRGGGWYDRFLSIVSPSWVRVGICKNSQMSKERLILYSWDQPVDWVLVSDGNILDVYETLARKTRQSFGRAAVVAKTPSK